MKVLVTDGHLKAALAAVRSLGRRGIEVHTTWSQSRPALCSFSSFSTDSHLLPHYHDEAECQAALLTLLRQERFDYLLPASEGAVRCIAKARDVILTLTQVDLPPPYALDLVLSKVGLLEFARKQAIPVPKTVVVHRDDSLERVLDELPLPLVAKVGGPMGAYDRVKYINTASDAKACLTAFKTEMPILFQEYIEGTGHGYFSFFQDGQPLLCQMHERIWEFPVTGGPSVLARTMTDPVLEALGRRLLEELHWHGLAMVEFRRSRDGDYKLMEINPRLWGSLDLSVAAGADFPFLAAQGRTRVVAAVPLEVKHTAFLWVCPDLILFVLASPMKAFQAIHALLSPRIRTNIFLDDLRPVFRQIRETMYWIKEFWPRGRLKYPHGKPLTRIRRAGARYEGGQAGDRRRDRAA